MMANLFNQFSTPTMMDITLLPIIMTFPLMLLPQPLPRLVQSRYVTLMRLLVKAIIKNLMPESKKNSKWTLMLTSLILLILTTNIIGLLPYTFTPMTQLSTTLALAIPLWMATVITGMQTQTTKSLAHLLPMGTPTVLIPILVMVETISLIVRPLALGVRLTANLTAGHILLQLISAASLTTTTTLPLMSPLTLLVVAVFTVLEIAVAMIQAYVFTLLVILYLQENT
uniref:ATP synthase subunit a n=1 Tax=Physignathus cocincinus TaxID=52200 RepID=A0A1B0QH97_PHYCN|nr:ATP synthase F0 subunit 6 [Physignathus cocincinus]